MRHTINIPLFLPIGCRQQAGYPLSCSVMHAANQCACLICASRTCDANRVVGALSCSIVMVSVEH